MDHTTLDRGAAQLYAKPEARTNIFKGERTGTQGGLAYTASFDIQQAPAFLLQPPPADLWAKSVDVNGKNPTPASRPVTNAFQLVFPQFLGSYTLGPAKQSGTTKVIVFATVSLDATPSGSKVVFKAESVWLDESHMTGWDRFILNGVILKQVLTQIGQMLAGFDIPALEISKEGVTVEFGTPVVSIVNSQLIAAAGLKAGAPVDIRGVTWPSKALFLLVSADTIRNVANQAAAKLAGQTKSGRGDYSKVITYDYTAKLNSVSITPNAADMTKAVAAIDFAFSATLKPLGIGGPCGVGAASGSM
jgi:hypothetical protein